MIPYINRFHGHNSLMYVYKNGQVVRSRSIVIRFIKNPHRKNPRITVIVSKKVLKSAVRRNRIRRRVYEYIRKRMPYLNGVYDIVFIITSSELLNMPYENIIEQINQIMDQAGIEKK